MISRPPRQICARRIAALSALLPLLLAPAFAPAQTSTLPSAPLQSTPAPPAPSSPLPPSSAAPTSASSPLPITLEDAIRRAQANEPGFAAALAESRASALDRSIARAALLPSAVYHNQVLYTQPNGQSNAAGQTGTQPAPRFIANNAVHEYASQAVVTETLGIRQLADLQLASANAARAAAELEVTRRGLVAGVVSLYFGVGAAERKLAIAERASAEAASFTTLTRQREQAREAAHADVVKAQLQQQQRERERADARLAAERARLELGVLLFPDPRTQFSTSAPSAISPLPSRSEVEALATRGNPELSSALASLRASNAEVLAARAAFFPDLGLNFNYGIDAPQFARNGPDGVRNLGYSAAATIDIPIWDWFSTQHRVRQSLIRRDAQRVLLTATQRRLVANLDEIYAEAVTARDQLDSLDLSARTAAESLRLTKLRYTNGEATVLEVVDAQGALTSAENAREDGAVRYRTALASLQTLTGSL